MSKFKAGDLAMIISCQLVPELIGKTVEPGYACSARR